MVITPSPFLPATFAPLLVAQKWYTDYSMEQSSGGGIPQRSYGIRYNDCFKVLSRRPDRSVGLSHIGPSYFRISPQILLRQPTDLDNLLWKDM